MRLVTFTDGDAAQRPRIGILTGEGEGARVLDVSRSWARAATDLGAFLQETPPGELDAALTRLRALAPRAAEHGAPLGSVRLLAPIPRPPKVTAIGLNYKDHAAEQGARLPAAPLMFAKARTAVTGPTGPVRIAAGQDRVDFEVELCLVVGRAGYRVPPEQARAHLLGYTVACDVSDRALQRSDRQWYRAKSFPTFCPTGPCVVTADALDPRALRLTTRLDGALYQDGTTADLIFPVEALLAAVSAVTPLEPGDLILTGTPAGVGVFRDPPVLLRPGSHLTCAIEGIGALELPIEHAAD